MLPRSRELLVRTARRLAAVATLGIMVCALAYAQSPAARAERDLLAAVNQARRNHGMAALWWDSTLAAAARRHAAVMAEHHSAQHGFDGEPGLAARANQAGAHFSWLSENIAQGRTSELIQAQFMKSPSHRANILDTDMNSIGVGVVERGGQLFAVEDFAQMR